MPVTDVNAARARQRLIAEIIRVHRASGAPPCACQTDTAVECYVTEAFETCTTAQLEAILASERHAAELPCEAAGRVLYQQCATGGALPWGDLPEKIQNLWIGRADAVVQAERNARPPAWAAADLIPA